MNKCTDCKHCIKLGEKLYCGRVVKPCSVNPVTGVKLYKVDWLGKPEGYTEGSCISQRENKYTFWRSRLRTDNCGVIARFHEPRKEKVYDSD